jgi:hypothetical protein
LTVNRLKLAPKLRRLLAGTNIIESCLSPTADLCRNVKRWRNANMAWRWAGTVSLEAEKRFHRLRGYHEMPLLIHASGNAVDSKEAVA